MFAQTFLRFSFLSFLALLLSSLVGGAELHAQFSWTDVYEGIEQGFISSITFGADGNPILATTHGLYKGWYDRETEEFQWVRFDTVMRSGGFHRSPGGTLFARTSSGIYTSENDGLTWDTIVLGGYYYYWFVHEDSTVGWYDSQERTLWITEDRGNTIRLSERSFYAVQANTEGHLYGQSGSKTIPVSYDKGKSWRFIDVSGHIAGPYIYSLKVIDNLLFLTDSIGLLRSGDGGVNWQRKSEGNFADLYKGENGKLYGFVNPPLNGDPYQLLTSTDAGITWEQTGTTNSPIFAADKNGRCFSLDYGCVTVSDNDGASWRKESLGLTNVNVNGIVSDMRNGMLYATFGRSSVRLLPSEVTLQLSLHRSTDDGRTWRELPDTLNRLLGVDSTGNLFALFDSLYTDSATGIPTVPFWTRTDKVLKCSQDLGDTWEEIPLTLDEKRNFRSVTIISSSAGVTVINWERYDNTTPTDPMPNTILISTNSGADWHRMENPLPDPLPFPPVLHTAQDGRLLLASAFQTDISYSFGMWRYDPVSRDLAMIDTIATDQFVEGEDGRLYRFSRLYHEGRIYASEDNGETWESIPLTGLLSHRIDGLKVGPDGALFVLTASSTSRADTLRRSADRGATWKPIAINGDGMDHYVYAGQLPALILEDGRIVDTLHFDIPGHPFDSPTSFYHYYGLGWSDNNGDSWSYDTAALNLKHITALARTPSGALIVGTQYDGLFLDESTLSVPPAQHSEQATAGLQVLPVPSGDRARALFRLETAGTVRLELYDLLGRRIAVLAHATLEAGEHAVPISLDNLPAGSYLLQLSTDAFTESVAVPVR